MDSTKIQNFGRENPHSDFPRFSSLAPNECAQLQSAIATRLGLQARTEPLVLLEALQGKAKPFTGADAQNAFDPQTAIAALGFRPRPEVLVNWYRFDKIDRIALSDLTKHFDDIWYPGSDDIEIFDESLDWFILVRHDGRVSLLNC